MGEAALPLLSRDLPMAVARFDLGDKFVPEWRRTPSFSSASRVPKSAIPEREHVVCSSLLETSKAEQVTKVTQETHLSSQAAKGGQTHY